MRRYREQYVSRLATVFIVCVTLGIVFSCAKKRAFNEENAQEPTVSSFFTSSTESAIADIFAVVDNQFLLRGKSEGISSTSLICGASVDTTNILTNGSFIITYNGTGCGGTTKTGYIIATITGYPLKKWKQKGCVIKADFYDYLVNKPVEGRSMKLKGSMYVTNESGSTWYDMRYLGGSPLTCSVSANDLSAMFDGSFGYLINIARRSSYSVSKNIITSTTEGLGTQGSLSGIDCWGLNSDGKSFTSQVTSPLQWNTSCGPWAPTSGETRVNVEGKLFEMKSTFGLDSNNDSFSGSGCPSGWKIEWSYKKKTNKRVFTYPK